jgi:hypothetical protein
MNKSEAANQNLSGVAETLLIKSLVLVLQEHFPGAELIFDAFSPFLVRANNPRFRIGYFSLSTRDSQVKNALCRPTTRCSR